jgi:hypothetical protein
MNWPALFLGSFVIGFVFSVVSFAMGVAGFDFHSHAPFVHHPQVPHAPAHAHAHAEAHAMSNDGVSPFNFATMMAFLAWFGGTGYLLTTQFRWLALPSIAVSTIAGVAGASIVFLMMSRVLWSPHENMRLADSHIIGVLGRVSQPIRQDGIGEVIYSSGGARRSCGARSADGKPIEKGAEVIVTAYERGIASVRRWEDLAAEKL